MAQISMTIVAKDPADFHHTMRELSETTLKLAIEVDASDQRLALEEARQEAYDAGVRDGKSEAQAENLHNKERNLALMLGHPAVMVSLQAGVAPFQFKPLFMCQYEQLSAHRKELLIAAGYEPCGDTSVGVFGWNYLAAKHLFITRIDHWTLAAPAAKA